MELFSVKDKVVIITGASRGIGRAIAEKFAAAGAIVYGTGSKPESIAWMNGKTIHGRVANLTETESMRNLLAELYQKHGRIDCLINNAGVASNTPASAIKEEEMSVMIETNFKAMFRACQAYYKLQKKNGGCIINISSVLGLVGTPLAAVYAGTKGAVIQMSKALAVEWAGNDFRVNAVCPGFIDTDMTEGMKKRPQVLDSALMLIPMKRLGRPEEIAGACLYLASDAASYVTGSALVVDGGLTSM